MPDPSSDDTLLQHRRNGSNSQANGNPPLSAPPPPSLVRSAAPAFFGTLGALAVLAILGVAAYYGYHAVTGSSSSSPKVQPYVATAGTPVPIASTPATASTASVSPEAPATPIASVTPAAPPAPAAPPPPVPLAKQDHPLNDPSTWVLSADPAQALTGDSAPDIGWWTKTFSLPNQDKVDGYLKNQGITIASVTPLHYGDTKDATTITYQVQGQMPDQLFHVPKASWAPSDPELQPLASVVVLNHDLPQGQFWNTGAQTAADSAGAKLNFAWKVVYDKNAKSVTADRFPVEQGVFTTAQVTQAQGETNGTVNSLRALVKSVDSNVDADTQAKLSQIPADPPKPELMSTHWQHGDGSGEPTKSAERMGGSTAAGAAAGAGFGAAAGDAGMGAGIGAGAGLLGGFIYDTVSKNNDRHRYEDHARAVNAERLDDWHDQLKTLKQQRAEIKKDAAAEKQQQLQDLAARLAAVGGHVDQLNGAPAATPQPAPTYSDAPQMNLQSQPQAQAAPPAAASSAPAATGSPADLPPAPAPQPVSGDTSGPIGAAAADQGK